MSVALVNVIFLFKSNKCITRFGSLGIGSRKKSFNSYNWLKRREADQYVEIAKKENYRCRSAYKLLEISDKYDLVKPGFKVLDVGAAPGSWSQVLANKTNSNFKDEKSPVGLVIAVDLSIIQPIEGVVTLSRCDFTAESTQNKILNILEPNEKFDFIFSDMAPSATGIKTLDRDKLINLIFPVFLFSVKNLKEGGGCLVKVLDGAEAVIKTNEIVKFFSNYKFIKPSASYQSSSELYVLFKKFLGVKTT